MSILTSAGLRRIEKEALRPQSARVSQHCAAAEFVNRLWMVLVDAVALRVRCFACFTRPVHYAFRTPVTT